MHCHECVVISQFLMPLSGLLEAIATVWGFLGRNSISFHIVEKRISFPVNEYVEDLDIKVGCTGYKSHGCYPDEPLKPIFSHIFHTLSFTFLRELLDEKVN